jgi:hypothetical protein
MADGRAGSTPVCRLPRSRGVHWVESVTAVMLHCGSVMENEPTTVPKDWDTGAVQMLFCELSYCALPYRSVLAVKVLASFMIVTAVVTGLF